MTQRRCFAVGRGKDIVSMTQDAKLVLFSKVVFSRGRGVFFFFYTDSTCQRCSHVEGIVCVGGVNQSK